MIIFNLRIPQSDQVEDGSCDFVAIEDQPTPLYDIDHHKIDQDIERITTFIQTLIEYAQLKFYSEENFIVEALTFVLLTCGIDITSKLRLLYYQLQNDYVPWGFSAPPNRNVKSLNSVDIFESLIEIMLRLDVNKKVLQCYHCKTKCSCEVVATYLVDELRLFTLQDPIEQEAEQPAEIVNNNIPAKDNIIEMKSATFIIDIPEEYVTYSSQTQNGFREAHRYDKICMVECDDEVATASIERNTPDVINPHIWKGHNDDGIPFINYDAMFGHTAIDLDLQLDCKSDTKENV